MKRTIIWVTAPAAAGKTTAIRELAKQLQPAQILSDGEEILSLNKDDKEHAYHTHPGHDEAFLLTSSYHFDQAVIRISQRATTETSITLVELARGVGESTDVDVSYKRLLRLIPSDIFDRSVFVYIKSNRSKRLQRNLHRKKENFAENIKSESFFVPQKAMRDFFIEDDFEMYKDTWPCPVFIIENKDVSLLEYKKHLRRLAETLVK